MEIPGEVILQQGGQVSGHGAFVPRPPVFADILTVLVPDNAAVGRQYGLRQGKQLVGVFRHCSVRICLFPWDLQESFLPEREGCLVRMLLKYEQVAAHLDTARLHEKRIGKPYRTDKVGMAHKILTHELVARRVGHAP